MNATSNSTAAMSSGTGAVGLSATSSPGAPITTAGGISMGLGLGSSVLGVVGVVVVSWVL